LRWNPKPTGKLKLSLKESCVLKFNPIELI